ncbi:single-stranded DNA-binding protein [Sphingomonas montanisoli]|uniref:Single-stranded DNA-binding protein n=1 Tax=Sphingomonas montanisoli TaxID=2606412 RepID=A0A5D9C5U7_9SPHN|nr:single-stranded DNA-binding protein [Sphingomonas montanisoli]TZG26492.1 single-stranded DNA-binding protein [Sphingomonas montanisoli]
MSGSVNKVIIVGNLGRDPEVSSFQNGGKIAKLRVATSEQWKDRASGEKRDRTEWHQVAITSEALVGVAEKYLRKGSKVYLEGQLQTRKWTDKDNIERYTTEIVVGGFKGVMVLLDRAERDPGGSAGDYDRGGWQSGSGGGAAAGGAGAAPESDLDDDVPF